MSGAPAAPPLPTRALALYVCLLVAGGTISYLLNGPVGSAVESPRVVLIRPQTSAFRIAAALKDAGVIPYFQAYNHPAYPQGFGAFASNMSVVDLLFNVGPGALDIIMSCNATREEIRIFPKRRSEKG